MLSFLALALTMFGLAGTQTSPAADEGFIREWLVLAPIPLEGDSGATEVDTDFIGGEEAITPKAGDKLAFGNTILTWTAHQAPDYYIDFLQAFGQQRGDLVAAYAVVYVHAAADTPLTLAIGTNDEGKAWLNGKEVFRYAESRGLDKDANKADVTLTKGRNVLVLKVINESNNWQGCARFLKSGVPVTTLTFSTAP